MLKLIRFVACMLLLAASSDAVAGTAPNPDACFTQDASALIKILPQRSTRSLLPVDQAIPAGKEGTLTIAGLGPPQTQKEWHFRLFVLSRSAGLAERHPTLVEDGASGALKGAYTIHFVAPLDGDTNPLDVRKQRSVIVVACDGDAIGAWAQRPIPFAPPGPARIWATLFVCVIYFGAAFIVYTRRHKAVEEKDDASELYRIAKVESWPFLRCLNPVAMTADMFDRGSLPKFQILFFVLLVAWGLAYLAIFTGVLSDLSTSLVYLLGLPALGSLGAQLTNTNRDRLSSENWAWLVTRRVLPINDPGSTDGPRWSDLVMSGTELDMSKLQALTFSFIVGFGMLATGPEAFGKFEVPTTLLQILGLSQFVLVGGRLVKPAELGEVDSLVKELRSREAALRKAASTGVDVDDSGKPLGPAPTTPPKSVPPDVNAAAQVVPVAVSRYRDTAAEVQVLLEAMANRPVDGTRLMNFKLP